MTAEKAKATRNGLLAAARRVLLINGFSGLSTRAVAREAEAPMSQIQYHFGSKEGMILALFEHMNDGLLERQNAMFNDPDLKLSEQWDLACDYLDEDLASGYVRVLHELWAAGWANKEIGEVVRRGLMGWQKLIGDLARKAEATYGSLGPFTPEEISALVGSAFIGAEAHLLLGFEDAGMPLKPALRRFGDVIRLLEDNNR